MEIKQESKEIFQDDKTKTLYIVENLNNEKFSILETLKENKISDSSSESVERANALLMKCLDIQKEVFKDISSSVDQNLHKYLQISHTFSESKMLLDSNANAVHNLIKYFESKWSDFCGERDKILEMKHKLVENRMKEWQLTQFKFLLGFMAKIESLVDQSDEDTMSIEQLLSLTKDLKLCDSILKEKSKFSQLGDSGLVLLNQIGDKVSQNSLDLKKKIFANFSGFLREKILSGNEAKNRLQELKMRREFKNYFSVFQNLGQEFQFSNILNEEIFSKILNERFDEDEDDESFSYSFNSISQLYNQNLRFLIEDRNEEIRKIIFEILASTLKIFIFDKKGFFPVTKMNEFSENFQKIYELITQIYKGRQLHDQLRSSINKKQGIIYKSYVIKVIKNIEKLLILTKKSITAKDNIQSLQEMLQKKYQNSQINEIILNMFKENFTSKMITRSLISKIFSLNIRILSRIETFMLDDQILKKKSCSYLMLRILDLYSDLKNAIDGDIQTIVANIFDQKDDIALQSRIIHIFGMRIGRLRDTALRCLIQNLSLKEKLGIENHFSDIAMKMGMTFELQRNGSLVINKLKTLKNLLFEENNIWALDDGELLDGFQSFGDDFLREGYQKEIDRARENEKQGAQFSKKMDKNLSDLLAEQMQVDLDAYKESISSHL